MAADSWQIWIDTGGTFTDCLARDPEGRYHRVKVLSSGSLRGLVLRQVGPTTLHIEQQWSAPTDFPVGFQFHLLKGESAPSPSFHPETPPARVSVVSYDPPSDILELSDRVEVEPGSAFEVQSAEEAPVLAARLVTGTPGGAALPPMTMRLATTRGTNALLERRGARMALFITRGFRDLLAIGDQTRPDLFALDIRKPAPLYTTVIDVLERLDAAGNIIRPLQLDAVEAAARKLRAEGFDTAAVALLHSYRNPEHEQAIVGMLKSLGFRYVSASSELSRTIKILPRAETAVVDAYLSPVVQDYLDNVRTGIGARNMGEKEGSRLHVMTSAGSLVGSEHFHPAESLLSGPAGGVVGAATVARQAGFSHIIAFDMGGTSTDVSRFDGDFEYVFEHRVGDAGLSQPALAIETVAAGGGSICSFDGHGLKVGPESAGATPGPACYGAGGPLTLTDVHLLLGRLDPDRFEIPVIPARAEQECHSLLDAIAARTGRAADRDETLEGLLTIANERMADAIRTVSVRRGYDPAEYALVAFGGAGGQHACAVASLLGIRTILAPPDAGLLSALGLGSARIERFVERQVLQPLTEVQDELPRWLGEMGQQASRLVMEEGIEPDRIKVRRRIIALRLQGQESTLSFEYQADPGNRFRERYRVIYGHEAEGKPIEVESLRVVAAESEHRPPTTDDRGPKTEDRPTPAVEIGESQCYSHPAFFGGEWVETPHYHLEALEVGTTVEGPAIVLDRFSTLVVEPGWNLRVIEAGIVVEAISMEPSAGEDPQPGSSAAILSGRVDPVQLELFTNRFQAIVGEMGAALERTAVSTNVKERLDFSCALLDGGGELVVNAPHIPVHLGALGLCVRRLREVIPMNRGDVVYTNHPAVGGSHLPDITVVTPVFAGHDSEAPIGYVASRAHHAEIGGSRPGSAPPDARTLAEEGVVIHPDYLVRAGEAQWDKARQLLLSGPYPSRAVEDNLADLRAAVAANERGSRALRTLCGQYGSLAVEGYMQALKARAHHQTRAALDRLGDSVFQATERLDDGSPLCVGIRNQGERTVIDFSGSAGVHLGNLNATPAIVRSVVLYVLRLLIDQPLPLNEGILQPVDLIIPPGILNPEFPADPGQAPAVLGGNVETSQRLVDTLLKALGLAACSQGTMNNLVFGNETFGYYETICGGCGAGPGWNGANATHSHMTNTRITDPEILEHRYPVRLERFSIRKGSGGPGRFHGGEGVLRELLFLDEMDLSVISQHRVEGPYGCAGGQPGKTGQQYVIRASGEPLQLRSVDGCTVHPGDWLILKSPGGGGWGKE